MSAGYTDADVQLVAEAMAGPRWKEVAPLARVAVAALAGAGRLTPDGPREIHVLGHGSYSDYGIVAAFTDPAIAAEVEATDSEFSVQEIPLLGDVPVKTVTNHFVHAYVLDSKPPIVEGPFTRFGTHWSWNGEPTFGPERPKADFDWYPPRYGVAGRWAIRAECRDEALAVKSVQDRLSELLAKLTGVADGPLPGVEADEDGTG